MPLFRPEALRGQDTLHGEVSLVPPVSWQLLGGFLFGAVALALLFLALAGYAKVTVVKGVVTGDKGVVRVAPPRTGVVEQVYVHEGQDVAAGAPLARISVSAGTLEGAAAVAAQRAELSRRLRSVQQAAAERLAALEAQAAGGRAQLASLDEQVIQERALLRVAEEDLARIQPAVRQGFVNLRELRQREEQVALRKQNLSRLAQLISERRTTIRTAEADMDRVRAEAAGQMNQVGEAQAELTRAAAGADLASGTLLRAPVDGVVTALVAHPGDPAAPATPLMTLVPKGTRLEAALAAPPDAAGLLEPGQPVRIAVDAFPYQVFGPLEGRVTTISRAAAPAPGLDGDAFLVRTTLPQTVDAYGAARPLRPGMTLTARIRTRERTLLSWIFDPVLAVGRR